MKQKAMAKYLWIVGILLTLLITGCGPAAPAPAATSTVVVAQPTTTQPAETATAPATYTDPFAYCAAAGTIDAPDASYTGDLVPQPVLEGLQRALNAPDLPPEILQNGSTWRCMDGQVYACFVGANLPCEAKANTDRTPTQEEIEFCQQNPDSDFIPAVVTGRETVFEWRCRGGAPEIVQQVFQPDAAGFLSEIWYQLGPGPVEPAGDVPSPTPPAQLPNPASENCIAVGGTLFIETRGDGGQYGICLFEDNRQCEEWALFRGECPVGGLKVTGYITPAAVYCAITGGEYAITGNSGADDEQGTCTLSDGSLCDAWDYYDGKCVPGPAPADTSGSIIQPLTMEVCDGQAQAMSHALGDLVPTQSDEPLEDPVSNVKGTGCQATITGSGLQFDSPIAVVDVLGAMLEEQGWTADPMLVADGPTGTARGYRKNDQICMAAAIWEPDDSANCPKDQPISACPVNPEQQNYTVTLNCGVATQEGGSTGSLGSAELVFDSTRGGAYRDLYVMSREGYDLSRLTSGEGDSFAGPWSPDGTRIVFTAFGLTTSDIMLIDVGRLAGTAGISPVNLTDTPDIDEGFPAWSPDGTHIAFTTRRDGNNEIYVMNADGSNPSRWTDNPADDFAPAWSPDGSQIAFVSDRDREPGVYDLFIMEVVSTAVTRLTDDEAIDYSPAWSPDGTRIAFRSHHGGPADIYVINVDGTGLTNLTQDPADDWAPSWSPDGSQIAFQSNRDGNWEVYVMNADGTGVKNLTQDPADDQLPFWRP